MKIGAIISVSESAEDPSLAPSASTTIGAMANCRLDILGKSLLDRTLDKLHRFGVDQYSIISAEDANQELISSSRKTVPADFNQSWEQWQHAVAGYIRDGIDRLLLLRLSAYTDLDYGELLQFHEQTRAALTRAYGEDGALDVTLVEASQLRNTDLQNLSLRILDDGIPSTLISQQRQFHYCGYTNRLATPQDWYSLVDDGLHGRCGLTPSGRRIGEHIWQADDCELDPTVRISGPAFIGTGTRVGACCVIAPGTSIERDCEIDCGTTVQQSWIQQNTYVGVALDVRRSLVSNSTLFNLERNVRVNIGEARLVGTATRSTSFLEGLGSFIWDSNAR